MEIKLKNPLCEASSSAPVTLEKIARPHKSVQYVNRDKSLAEREKNKKVSSPSNAALGVVGWLKTALFSPMQGPTEKKETTFPKPLKEGNHAKSQTITIDSRTFLKEQIELEPYKDQEKSSSGSDFVDDTSDD